MAKSPLKRLRGELHSLIMSEDFELDAFKTSNESSVVVGIVAGSEMILLAGDSTLSQWKEHRGYMRRNGAKENIGVTILKAPHHGSRYNNTRDLFDYLLASNRDHILIISANGSSHPHFETLDLADKLGIAPFCTGMSRHCENSMNLEEDRFDPAARPFLRHYVTRRKRTPCQGDVIVQISGTKREIFNTTGSPCVYTGLRKKLN